MAEMPKITVTYYYVGDPASTADAFRRDLERRDAKARNAEAEAFRSALTRELNENAAPSLRLRLRAAWRAFRQPFTVHWKLP
jgi:hypothetical protein